MVDLTRQQLVTKMLVCGVPETMWGGLERYILNRVAPGHFLQAVLKNDLRDAVGRADDENAKCLRNFVVFLHNYAPGDCWGSPEKYAAYLRGEGSSEAA